MDTTIPTELRRGLVHGLEYQLGMIRRSVTSSPKVRLVPGPSMGMPVRTVSHRGSLSHWTHASSSINASPDWSNTMILGINPSRLSQVHPFLKGRDAPSAEL